MRFAVLTALLALAASGTAGAVLVPDEPDSTATAERAKPVLRVLARSPAKVSGRDFVARERIRLSIITNKTLIRRVRAGVTGTFTTVLQDVTLSRCETWRIVAIGGAGSRAVLKWLPQPACKTS